MRVPNDSYMPDFDDEDHIFLKEKVSLNKVSESPFLISPHVVDMTKKYSEKKMETAPVDTWSIDWKQEYRDSFFVPENRWTSEVVRQPVKVNENLFKITISADVYIKEDFDNSILDQKPTFITRTLYPYISKNILLNNDIDKDIYFPYTFFWTIRWLPQNPCTLTFYTDEEIEKNTYTKASQYKITIDDVSLNVDVPFIVKREIFNKMTVLRHDSDILYMKVEE